MKKWLISFETKQTSVEIFLCLKLIYLTQNMNLRRIVFLFSPFLCEVRLHPFRPGWAGMVCGQALPKRPVHINTGQVKKKTKKKNAEYFLFDIFSFI